jgi:preprotein translocase subunit Sec63
VYYGFTIRAGDAAPQPGTALFDKHRRNILCGVIGAYLLYKIYEADWNLQRGPDFYQVLGVSFDVDERTLKSKIRRL